MMETECYFIQINAIFKDYFVMDIKLRVLRFIRMVMNMKEIIWIINGMVMEFYKIADKNINLMVYFCFYHNLF